MNPRSTRARCRTPHASARSPRSTTGSGSRSSREYRMVATPLPRHGRGIGTPIPVPRASQCERLQARRPGCLLTPEILDVHRLALHLDAMQGKRPGLGNHRQIVSASSRCETCVLELLECLLGAKLMPPSGRFGDEVVPHPVDKSLDRPWCCTRSDRVQRPRWPTPRSDQRRRRYR